METLRAEPIHLSRCTLGEGPVWQKDSLWWVDIEGRLLHKWIPLSGEKETFPMPERIGFAVPTGDADWIIGLQSGIYRWNPVEGSIVRLHAPEPADKHTRFNDGKCDPHGRLWAGTMSLRGESGAGSLYRISGNACDRVLSDVCISNGLAWSRDSGRMYYIDTPTGEVASFDFEPESGAIANRRAVVRFERQAGAPDGMTIDAEGRLWVALWGGFGVQCIDPLSGQIIARVNLPVPNVTSCTFGGPEMNILYITTARAGLDQKTLARHPHAGDVFSVQTQIKGTPVDCFHPTFDP
ncbi:MAG: SMP-30/gluconolactonase/LRE family protein [Oceanipulchritudo sp.]